MTVLCWLTQTMLLPVQWTHSPTKSGAPYLRYDITTVIPVLRTGWGIWTTQIHENGFSYFAFINKDSYHCYHCNNVWVSVVIAIATWQSALYNGRRSIGKEHTVPYNVRIVRSWLLWKMRLLNSSVVGLFWLGFLQKLLGNWKRSRSETQLLGWVISAGNKLSYCVMPQTQRVIIL